MQATDVAKDNLVDLSHVIEEGINGALRLD
jgi:hypothetical protein